MQSSRYANFFFGGLHCIKDFFATKGNVFQRFGLTLALSGSPCHCDSAHSDSLGLFLLFSAHSGSLSLAFWGAHRLIRSLLGSLRRSCVAPVYLVHCPIQLICNRIFIRFKFVFHDKAKRTQHRNLLQFFPPWCHQTQSSKQYSTIVITNHHPINDQGGWWLVPRSTIQTESLESKNFLQNHSRNCLSWSYNYDWYKQSLWYEVTYLYISGKVTVPKQSEFNVNSYNIYRRIIMILWWRPWKVVGEESMAMIIITTQNAQEKSKTP